MLTLIRLFFFMSSWIFIYRTFCQSI